MSFTSKIAASLMLAGLAVPARTTVSGQAVGDRVPPAATPRVYQRAGAQTDIFALIRSMEEAAARQPPDIRGRRAAMVQRIRQNIDAAGSTIDKAEVERVLAILGTIPREKFVDDRARRYAYLSFPLQIGYDQTISDAYIVAVMTAAVRVRPGENVLDVGTGSGYQAAVLARLAGTVSSIEIVEPLARRAGALLKRLRYRNVAVVAGDGFAGVPTHAPFDAIVVAAGVRSVPTALLDQLKPGGRLVIPIGPDTFREQLVLIAKSPTGEISRCRLGPAAFVPFTGQAASMSREEGDVAQLGYCYGRPIT